MMVMTFQRMSDMSTPLGYEPLRSMSPASRLLTRAFPRRFLHRFLPLVSADRRLCYLDPHFVGNLQLHTLLAEARDLAVDAARRDDTIVDLQVVEELLHLLLLALHRQQDDEVKDRQDDGKRYELQPRIPAVGSSAHGEHAANFHHH